MLGTTLHHRFRLEQVLHRAATGPLYLATDERSGEMLAVKVFPAATDLAADDGLRYRHAMERLAGLQHPQLLAPIHTGTADGVPFQVLPYFPGDDLDAALADGPLDARVVTDLLRQAALGLDCLHSAGLRHLNLKPANLLLSRAEAQPALVLCDPLRHWIVRADAADAAAREAAWRAPEQAPALEPLLDAAPDGRADLYTLGLLAHRMLTGHAPFTGATAAQVAHQHVVAQAPDVREAAPETPAALAAIVARLLAKRPHERYQTAAGLLADLAPAEDATESHAGEAVAFVPGGRDRPDPCAADDRAWGREAARDAVLTGLAHALEGRGAWVRLRGEPGSGRTRLLHSVLAHLEADHALVLRAPAVPPRWAVPWQLPGALLRALLQRWPDLPETRRTHMRNRLVAALGEHTAVLTGIVPALSMLLPEAGALTPLPIGRERLRVLQALTEAFVALAEPRRPVLLWMEGVLAADADSIEWLAFLARRLPQAALLVVTEEAPGTATEQAAALPTGAGVQQVDLAPLTTAQTARWLAACLGRAEPEQAHGAGDTPTRLAAWMHERWGGRPLALQLALRLLVAKGLLGATGAAPHWRVDWQGLESQAWPESLAALVQHRLELLPDDVQPVLQAVATGADACSPATLAAMLEPTPPALLVAPIEAALAGGVLVRGTDGLRFANTLVREAVRRATPPATQEALHQALAAALEAEESAAALPELQRHARAALHFRAGADAVRWGEHAAHTVRHAWRQQALHAVCAWSEAVLAGQPEHAQRADVLLTAGIAHAHVGAPEVATARLDAARALGLTESDDLTAVAWRAWAESRAGDDGAALRTVAAGLAAAGEPLPSNAVGAALARVAGTALRHYESLRAAASGEAAPALSERERAVAELLALASHLLAQRDPPRAALADERILRLAAGHAPSPHVIGALLRLGRAAGAADAPAFARARALLEQHDFPHARAAYHAALGSVQLAAGQWRAAREALRVAREGFRRMGALPDEGAVLAELIEVERQQGAFARAEQARAELAGLATLQGDAAQAGLAAGVGAYLAAITGTATPEAAGEALRAQAARVAQAGQPSSARYLLALAAELALAAQDLGELLAAVRAESELPPGVGGYPEALFGAALAEGHLVQAVALPAEAHHHLDEARGLLRDLSAAFGEPVRPDMARCVAMDRLLSADEPAALRTAELALQRLEADGVLLASAWLRFRLAEGLKAGGHPDWMHWAGEALTTFDTLGCAPHLAAVRRLLEMSAPAQDVTQGDRADAAAEPAGAASAAGLAVLEQIGAAGGLPPEAVQDALLAHLLRESEAAFAGWLLPREGGGWRVLRRLPEGAPIERFATGWLAEGLEAAGEAQGAAVLGHLRPGESGASGVPEPFSLLALPIGAPGPERPVALLGAPTAQLVFDRQAAALLAPLGRQAATALALNARLLAAGEAARRAEGLQRRQAALIQWAADAGQQDDPAQLLAAYGEHIAATSRCSGALLCTRREDGLQLVATHGAVPSVQALAALFPLPLLSGQAYTALARRAPVGGAALDTPPPSAAEQALFEALRESDGLWLPLLRQGHAFGAVLLLGWRAEAALAAGSDAVEETLLTPLRLIAPAIHAATRPGRMGSAAGVAAPNPREAGLYRAFLPAGWPERAEALRAALDDGLVQTVPVLAGVTAGWGADDRDGQGAGPNHPLRRYVARVAEALALHDATLAAAQGQGWIATFPAGVDGALWGAQTLFEMLHGGQHDGTPADARDDGAGEPLVFTPPQTGLGLHLGTLHRAAVPWRAPAGEERRLPLIHGAGVRQAERLAELSLSLRCGILVSGATIAALGDGARFDLRHLGKLRPAPGEARVDVYELFSVRAAEVAAPMRSLQGVWAEALREFQRGRWLQAAGGFRAYAERLPQDRPARYFLRQCDQRARGA